MDADGDLVTGAAGLDSEVSKDGGTFADCTNEATEIATSSGMYYLDLTSTEMNADCVAIIVKTSTSGAKTVPIVLYPQESGDIKVDVQSYGGTAGTFSGGRPEVNTTHAAGTAWGSGAITAGAIATDAIGAAEIATDAVTEIVNAVWAAATRTLTANTNLNDLNAAGVRAALGLTSANLDTQIGTLATASNLATVASYIDTEVAAILAAVDTEVAAIKAKTDNLPSDPADASVIAGRFDTLDSAVADLPTNSELATALGAADDAILAVLGTPAVTIAADIAGISAGSAPSASDIADEVETRTMKANVVKVNHVTVTGTGATGDEWGP